MNKAVYNACLYRFTSVQGRPPGYATGPDPMDTAVVSLRSMHHLHQHLRATVCFKPPSQEKLKKKEKSPGHVVPP